MRSLFCEISRFVLAGFMPSRGNFPKVYQQPLQTSDPRPPSGTMRGLQPTPSEAGPAAAVFPRRGVAGRAAGDRAPPAGRLLRLRRPDRAAVGPGGPAGRAGRRAGGGVGEGAPPPAVPAWTAVAGGRGGKVGAMRPKTPAPGLPRSLPPAAQGGRKKREPPGGEPDPKDLRAVLLFARTLRCSRSAASATLGANFSIHRDNSSPFYKPGWALFLPFYRLSYLISKKVAQNP
jgi:hypothetical protein